MLLENRANYMHDVINVARARMGSERVKESGDWTEIAAWESSLPGTSILPAFDFHRFFEY
jgi:hypothetical protein